MRLLELEPRWLRFCNDDFASKTYGRTAKLSKAHGIAFLCPKCFRANNGTRGTHSIICWRPIVPIVPQSVGPKPGRWEFTGTGFQDLSLVAGSSSVLLLGGCCAHFFVRKGEIVDC